MDDVLFAMVKKTLDLHVFPNLAFLAIVFTNFDLYMFKGSVNIFALMIKNLNESQTPMHVDASSDCICEK